LSLQRDQQQQQQKQRNREYDQIEWRRCQVLELSSQGQTERQIATVLQVGKTTVHKDLTYLSRQARESLRTHVQDKLPEEYQKCMVGINQVLNMAWSIVNKSLVDDKTRLQALALINDCNKYKMDLTTGHHVTTTLSASESTSTLVDSEPVVLLRLILSPKVAPPSVDALNIT
jgi:hypothetical protein